MTQRIHYRRVASIIESAVAELPLRTCTKGVHHALLSHDEAVISSSRRTTRPDSRQRFCTLWQQLTITRAPIAKFLYLYGQTVGSGYPGV